MVDLKNKNNLLDNCLVYENLNFYFSADKPISNQSLEGLLNKNSNLIQLVKFIYNSLLDMTPQDVVVLIADKKGIVLEILQHGDGVNFLNIQKGMPLTMGQNNPIAITLKERKTTVCKGIVCEGKIDLNWTIITLLVNPIDPYGLISIVLPTSLYSTTLVNLLNLLCNFISLSIFKSEDIAQTQLYYQQMFSSLAHEVKNILTTIRGFIQLLGKDEKNPVKIGYSNFILKELDRAHETLKNSIFYTAPKEQRVNLCKIDDIIFEIISNLNDLIIRYNINLNLQITNDLPSITGDKTQFRQVFLNIIQNAIEAMTNGGTLTIKCYVNNQQIYTIIEDTGSGIPTNIKNKIFQPFFTTKYGGTGLGLSVVKQIVEQYKGQIFVKSHKNKGTSFTIILPI
ncbi:two-component system sensor histidine kinase NtrB [Anaerobranca gottschalkii]|uniref:histidine kinase n=1 Tax=Anaerobranca gottschalkii DSM 13577 TaxID=1120990 RepID=A0A1I0AI87_9FIRM|nr:ATP-binding protein [Anaerobranca gottschalkii]SES92978.1 Signal transduction histidine kinase [Anaerobranca gottschalkii DSM 13577]